MKTVETSLARDHVGATGGTRQSRMPILISQVRAQKYSERVRTVQTNVVRAALFPAKNQADA